MPGEHEFEDQFLVGLGKVSRHLPVPLGQCLARSTPFDALRPGLGNAALCPATVAHLQNLLIASRCTGEVFAVGSLLLVVSNEIPRVCPGAAGSENWSAIDLSSHSGPVRRLQDFPAC